ncbi:glycyl-radical enzyme activating protein [Faecalicatena contorta]|uniref:(2S)-3-sulfopropanediol dehydratase activating enzyme n=1 Tax=Faecalicatena contorta TaxID=39482 RepID=UPI00129D2BFA|nr:glycyl-radical enzyme activating protein [Faecalicatena contorta]MRM88454.1 glycyl-radical enzyme activating protein [Faecalicatena contorta]
MVKGIVFNVQRFTIHDGPGIRTELFLKGCPLRCEWCSNPESWHRNIEVGIYASKCISKEKCGACENVCPVEGAINFENGIIESIDRDVCTNCMKCYNSCPAEAIKAWGKMMTVEECMEITRKDRGFYDKSGGGVTVSGGDPFVQSDFVMELFKACKQENIQTCIESTFYAKWEQIEKVLPYTDLIISDIKHMNSEIHKKHTGVDNHLILENLQKLANDGREMILRIPVIPNVNDDMENIEKTADFIIDKLNGNVRTLQLLSFMRLGEEKYQSLGITYKMEELKIDRKKFQDHVNQIAIYFNNRGIHCQVGTKEKQ